ncbi:MAG: glycoside hydrolase [Planctomycetaceae bacterium]|jgi:hypothetical protein|nr:glycoside hydrolase [Planctomycetaceae bacterium]
MKHYLSIIVFFVAFLVHSQLVAQSASEITIPMIDLSGETERQVVVEAGTETIYQGHPTTVLLPDGKTMYAVWTINHGGPCGPMKKSVDGGKTWGEFIETPESWKKVKNCPAIYRLTDPQGKSRLFVFACNKGSMVRAVSENDGETWSDMESFETNISSGVMPWCTIIPINQGKQLIAATNRRRPNDSDKFSNQVIASTSNDGGFTWSQPVVICDIPEQKPCEPCFVRSPDGKQIACIMRENVRKFNAHIIFSNDEGKTWTKPREVPSSQSGDRHQAVYSPDGRLVMVFRDTATQSKTKNHFVAWVGTFDDLVNGTEGQYRIKLLHSYAGGDCGYPGLEILPDGTFVATTYIKYRSGKEKHSVVSTRFRLDEIDKRAINNFKN